MEVMINYIAVLAAAVASFLIGWVWYGMLFQKQWMKLSGITMASMKKTGMSPGKAMSLGFVSQLIVAYVLAHFIDYMMAATLAAGAQLAFWLWFGFVMPIMAGIWIWEGKPFMLFVLNAAHWLVALLVMSGILAVWP